MVCAPPVERGFSLLDEEAVLVELRQVQQDHAGILVWAENLAYLEKREQHMHYLAYQAAGLPIASGVVESGNKLVVEARLKGAGMHWARSQWWRCVTACATTAGMKIGRGLPYG